MIQQSGFYEYIYFFNIICTGARLTHFICMTIFDKIVLYNFKNTNNILNRFMSFEKYNFDVKLIIFGGKKSKT